MSQEKNPDEDQYPPTMMTCQPADKVFLYFLYIFCELHLALTARIQCSIKV